MARARGVVVVVVVVEQPTQEPPPELKRVGEVCRGDQQYGARDRSTTPQIIAAKPSNSGPDAGLHKTPPLGASPK